MTIRRIVGVDGRVTIYDDGVEETSIPVEGLPSFIDWSRPPTLPITRDPITSTSFRNDMVDSLSYAFSIPEGQLRDNTRLMPPEAIRVMFGGNPENCPFCDSPNVALYCGPTPHMTCLDCGADGPTNPRGRRPARSSTDNTTLQAQAVILWNERR